MRTWRVCALITLMLLGVAVTLVAEEQENVLTSVFSTSEEIPEVEEGETNYQTCMRECRADGHSFIFCQGECKSLAETATTGPTSPESPEL